MKLKIIILMAVTALAVFAHGDEARAANGYTTGTVNMRAGPGTDYPRVATVPEGSPVTIHGCTAGYRWCDTSWRNQRGWISANYLNWASYRGRSVYLPNYAGVIGVPVIGFYFDDYWYDYYRYRPWYKHRHRWHHRPPHHHPGKPGRPGRPGKPGKPDRPDWPDRPGKPGKPDRPSRLDRPNRPDWPPVRPGINRPDRPSRMGRPNRPDRSPAVRVPRNSDVRVVPRVSPPQVNRPAPRLDTPRPMPQMSRPSMRGGGGGGGGEWRRIP
ncbi:SH3 domain-containing protein [Rhodoligotrophos defluvii]|uniref:SH3 domain-containing protein n=1 Tax=Rhodoligotrophos defluvii TaxID=2561934 RepID=UPI0010C98C1A|nr:SH3 domain-containing protein [Rhodoligotrophos defluvii]